MLERQKINTSVRALMSSAIDYAGMYPPANLSLEVALHNFVEYQSSADAWMLSRFVLPARRLAEVTELAAREFPPNGILKFAALGRGGVTAEEFRANLEMDIADIAEFRVANRDRVRVDVYEAALPAAAMNDRAAVVQLLRDSAAPLFHAALAAFFEAPWGEGWDELARQLLLALYEEKSAGYKLRTGGTEANKFPTPEQVGMVVTAAMITGVPLKFTAGLHHPLRHYDPSVQTKMHGFLNVFTAAVLTLFHSDRITPIRMNEIIADEDPSNFRFDEAGFAWKEFGATIAEIEYARQHALISFGSCSFDDPRQDLQNLGLLPR